MEHEEPTLVIEGHYPRRLHPDIDGEVEPLLEKLLIF
jgi:hypothetical protein